MEKVNRANHLLEIVSQRELNVTRIVHRTKAGAKRSAGNSRVGTREHVPVEGVEEFGLKDDGVRFEEAKSLDDREVLVEVALAADAADDSGHISKRKPSGSNQVRSVRVDKGRAIPVGLARWGGERSIGICRATSAAVQEGL